MIRKWVIGTRRTIKMAPDRARRGRERRRMEMPKWRNTQRRASHNYEWNYFRKFEKTFDEPVSLRKLTRVCLQSLLGVWGRVKRTHCCQLRAARTCEKNLHGRTRFYASSEWDVNVIIRDVFSWVFPLWIVDFVFLFKNGVGCIWNFALKEDLGTEIESWKLGT